MTELPTPDNVASTRICQNWVANPMAARDSDISSVPPIRKGRAPRRSTMKPTGVCRMAVVPDISMIVMPSSAKLTWNALCQARNMGGRQRT